MWYPDLLTTKAVALKRQEAQRIAADPYRQPAETRVYRGNRLVPQVRRLRTYVGSRLVSWGRRLQQYGEPPSRLQQTRGTRQVP
jgi:hypothetical protein